jgi:hypothetical protein
MAEALSTAGGDVAPAPERLSEEAEPHRSEPLADRRRLPGQPDDRSHLARFRAVYVVLAAVVVASAVAFVALLAGPSDEPEAAWSAWAPGSEVVEDRAQEIATHVGAQYRLDSGAQLVTVQATRPRVQDIPVAAVAIRSSPDGASFTGENIPVFEADRTMVYILCGLGPECAIEEGTPSEERQRLLRREALELALYTFRYVDDVDHVVAFMPPRSGYRPTYALFFQRPDLESLMDDPLRRVLPPPAPLAGEIPPSEVTTIDRLTNPHFFAFTFTQLQDGTAVLVLDDPQRAPPPQPIAADETGEGTTTAPTETGGTDGSAATDG